MDTAARIEPTRTQTGLPRPLGEVLRSSHLPALDGLRTIAVFIVMVFHYFDKGPADLGVSIFFVLSGFLISWLLLKEREKTGVISLKKFYVRRTLRIFPAYYVYLALSIALAVWRGHLFVSKGLVACALTYTVNYYEAFLGGPINFISHGWSLAQEEQFYLIWPFAFALLARRGLRGVAMGLGAAIVVTTVWRSWLYLSGTAGAAYVYHAFDTRFDNLAVGCLLAVLMKSERPRAWAAMLARWVWMPLATVALLLASRWSGSLRYHYSLGFTVDAILVAILIAQLLQLGMHPLFSWLENRVVKYLGTISYPLYLYHGLAWSVGQRLKSLSSGVPVVFATLVPFVLTILVSIAIAAASYHLIEKRFLAFKGRFAV